MISEICKLLFLISILASPQRSSNSADHPFFAIQAAISTLPVAEASQETDISFTIQQPGPAVKEWRLNTNFENVDNWQGLVGHENCSKNIYEFPSWSREKIVVTFPSQFTGQQIILPVNGHLVLQEGVTSFSPKVDPQAQQTSCRGREVKFTRVRRADWFDPDNWSYQQNSNPPKTLSSSALEAIPHLERVPCQYDTVNFPENSTFNLKITSNVTIANFMLGNKKFSYTEVAILMNSALGKLQFSKDAETMFSITMSNENSTESSSLLTAAKKCAGSNAEITDSDQCICAHYSDSDLKQKICALADCKGSNDLDEQCPNPITPHGFCCPICGFHIKIRHSGNLRLVPLYSKIKSEITRANLAGNISLHLNRYRPRLAHIIVVAVNYSAMPTPTNQQQTGSDLLQQIGKLVLRLENILKNEESEVLGVALSESWGNLLPSGDSIWSGGNADRLQGSGLGGGIITLIVFLCLIALFAGLVLFIFIWNKNHAHDPLTFNSVTSVFARVPSMRIPIVPGSGASRRSSAISNSLYSFGFARFTNERGSSVTIGAANGDNESSEGGSTSTASKKEKSSTIRRTEQVDDQAVPPESESSKETEKVSDVNSGQFGFSSVSYDLVAGSSGENGDSVKAATTEQEQPAMPLLTIPEVVVVDMEDGDNGGSLIPEPPIIPERPTPEQAGSSSSSKPKSSGKKLTKPGFIASRLAGTYKKFAPEVDDDDVSIKETEIGEEIEPEKIEPLPVNLMPPSDDHQLLQVPAPVLTDAVEPTPTAQVAEAKIIDFEE